MTPERVVIVRRVLPAPPYIVYDLEHEQLPPEQVDDHQRGWAAIAVQLGEALIPGAGAT